MNEHSIATTVAKQMLDPQVRVAMRENPRQYAIKHGIIAADSPAEIKLVTSAPNQMLIPLMKINAHGVLSDHQLGNIQAAGSVSSVACFFSTISSASTIATPPIV